jgi:hypothetical protein
VLASNHSFVYGHPVFPSVFTEETNPFHVSSWWPCWKLCLSYHLSLFCPICLCLSVFRTISYWLISIAYNIIWNQKAQCLQYYFYFSGLFGCLCICISEHCVIYFKCMQKKSSWKKSGVLGHEKSHEVWISYN